MLEETTTPRSSSSGSPRWTSARMSWSAASGCPAEAGAGRRLQEVRTYSTMTRSLLGLADRLAELGVTRVVMEATSDYWKPPFYVLEARGSSLAGKRPRREAPAGPAQDRQAGRGVAVQGRRASDAPGQFRAAGADPPAAGPDPLPRRPGRGAHRGEERVEKLLEDAQIKLVVVASDIFGVSGRAHAGRPDRRRARPQGAGAAGPDPAARQARCAGGGVHRALHRPSRFLLAKMLAR